MEEPPSFVKSIAGIVFTGVDTESRRDRDDLINRFRSDVFDKAFIAYWMYSAEDCEGIFSERCLEIPKDHRLWRTHVNSKCMESTQVAICIEMALS